MKKYILICILFLGYSLTISSQETKSDITGMVIDEAGEPLIGVSIVIKDNPGLGTVTDIDGKFNIKAFSYQVLVFTYVGFEKQEIPIKNQKVINVTMEAARSSVLDEVTVTGTGIQKKATVTGAITTVDVNTLKSTGGISINNALAGNVAGIIAMQTSGEPGKNTAEFWIRGISTFGAGTSALVLVDGFERSMSELNIEDIESFSVLKDASATAIYGSRGANGVILINTKRGQSGKINIDTKIETSYNTRTRTPEFVDGYTYAQLMNEAKTTRNFEPEYTPAELEILRLGMDPDLYPNVNWKDVLLKDGAWTKRVTLNVSGGGTTARYYMSGSFLDDEGMYKTDETLKNKYNTNANLTRWNYRMNVDVDITPTTLVKVGVSGSLQKHNRPGQADDVWKSIIGQNPVSIPLMYSNGMIPSASGDPSKSNPWVVATQTGYREHWENKVQTNITLEQNLNMLTKGLSFIGRFGFDVNNWNTNGRVRRPEQYYADRKRDANGNLVMRRMQTEELMSQVSSSNSNRLENLEAELHYSRMFVDAHNVGLTLKYSQRQETQTANVSDIIQGISRRYQGVSGRMTYGYKYRYFVEFNFGYTGSENFSNGDQFGFFPAISGGWNIAEEPFIKNNLQWLEMLKVRYSYGEVGNDRIRKGDQDVRYPYLSSFGDTGGWNYGDILNKNEFTGLHYSQVASPNLKWEIAKKHDLGLDIDMALFGGRFSLTADIFKDTRERIFMERKHLPQIIGLTSQPWANVGKMESKGLDGNFMVQQKVGNLDITLRGNMTYAKTKVLEYDEEANAYPYQRTEGFRLSQERGYIALGLFKDYDDIRNSPRQDFGTDIMPGDIKYQDVNGDGVINSLDQVPIGATITPNLIYGMGLSVKWKDFDFNIHFQGSGKSAYKLNGPAVYPFSEKEWGNILTDVVKDGNRWISRDISGDPATENPKAKYPRLTYGWNNNNYQPSTFWLCDGRYIRLKTLELGYNVPKRFINRLRMNNVRVYFIGNNLAVWSPLDLWDPELAAWDGMAYPLAKTLTLGLTVTF
ncbi:MAG: TonB-dependent receptor [Dysgonomonas sp.]|nr:TonB-dependent receptor [Dysgonomonas sp.]